MTAYYNEIDPYAAEWLRNLIKAGHIAPGDVDERSIEDVRAGDLRGYTQCHFFAGVGVWSYALRRAGWHDDRPVWTGSCPCQPFSAAGKGVGFVDERHLWPAWFHLINQCKPVTIFGEQVASRDGLAWLDLVQADLEGAGYACGAVDLCAAGVGAPHIRQRLFWVANGDFDRCGAPSVGTILDQKYHAESRSRASGLANTVMQQRPDGEPGVRAKDATGGWQQGATAIAGLRGDLRPGPTHSHWRDADWLCCRDGKWRPVEPGTFPLAHGATSRVGRLRAYGNAINAEVATQFIKGAMTK